MSIPGGEAVASVGGWSVLMVFEKVFNWGDVEYSKTVLTRAILDKETNVRQSCSSCSGSWQMHNPQYDLEDQ